MLSKPKESILSGRSPSYRFLSYLVVIALGLSAVIGGSCVFRHTRTAPAAPTSAPEPLAAFRATHEPAQKQALMQELLRIEPDTAYGHFAQAFLHAVAGHDTAAEAEYRAAIALKPDLGDAFLGLGSVLFNQDKNDAAIAAFKQAAALDPNRSEPQLDLGILYYALGDLNQAIAADRQAVAIDPKLAEGHYNLGLALYGAGRAADARTAFQRAVELEPDLVEARFNLAVALDILDEDVAAGREYQAFIDRAGDAHPDQTAYAQKRIAIITKRKP